MRVRPARLEDVPAIVALEAAHLGPDPWPASIVTEGVSGTLPTVGYLVATAAPDPAGAAGSVEPVVGHAVASVAGDLAELQRLAVDTAHRRRGVASALVDEVVRTARAAGADRLLLEVREDNPGALALYTRLGFAEIDRRRRYYRDGTTAVVLLLPLGAREVPPPSTMAP